MISTSPLPTIRLTHPCSAYIDLCAEGASIIRAVMPDRNGVLGDVILGYPSLRDWQYDTNFMGRTIGRFANRIAGASFSLNGTTYSLEKNDGDNCNHSGSTGIHHHIFNVSQQTVNSVQFSTISPAGEGGFPGTMDIHVTYRLQDDLSLHISYSAHTDSPTPISLTNHAYFNLNGADNILTHELYIPSQRMLETNASFIPTGKVTEIQHTAFDFTTFKPIGQDIDYTDNRFRWNRGYNHCYLFEGNGLREMAVLRSLQTGRMLTVLSTLPSLQVYSGGYLRSDVVGRFGRCIQPSDGIALEAQYYPDAPNRPSFPSCILLPGEEYNHEIVYKFSTF